MKTSRPKSKTKPKLPNQPAQPKGALPRFAQNRRRSGTSKAGLRNRLIERKIDGRRFIEFPQAVGRTLEKVELFTIPEYHSLTLYFQDKTFLTLEIDPCFLLASRFSDISTGNERVLKHWPVIRSTTGKA